MTKARGFTIIELMIVLAIVGILLAVAIPDVTNCSVIGQTDQGRVILKCPDGKLVELRK